MKSLILILTVISQMVFAETVKMSVPSISCGACAKKITNALKDVKDVEKVDVDVESKVVTVQTKGAADEQLLRDAVEKKAEFKVESISR